MVVQFKCNNSINKNNINDNKKGNKYTETNGNKNNIELNKLKISNNKIKEIIYDSDDEVENNLISLIDKPMKKNKRNSVETKKKSTMALRNLIKINLY